MFDDAMFVDGDAVSAWKLDWSFVSGNEPVLFSVSFRPL